MGPDILIDVSITVDGAMSASSAHQLGEHVRMRIMTRFDTVSDVRIHFDPSNREEFHKHANPNILPTQDVIDAKIRAVLRRTCPEILGVTEIFVVYNREGNITSKVNILLHPELKIEEANVIATRIREVLVDEIEEMR
jgi:divalent metal cation (Fe/Co/Zn/Cd) transporter